MGGFDAVRNTPLPPRSHICHKQQDAPRFWGFRRRRETSQGYRLDILHPSRAARADRSPAERRRRRHPQADRLCAAAGCGVYDLPLGQLRTLPVEASGGAIPIAARELDTLIGGEAHAVIPTADGGRLVALARGPDDARLVSDERLAEPVVVRVDGETVWLSALATPGLTRLWRLDGDGLRQLAEGEEAYLLDATAPRVGWPGVVLGAPIEEGPLRSICMFAWDEPCFDAPRNTWDWAGVVVRSGELHMLVGQPGVSGLYRATPDRR